MKLFLPVLRKKLFLIVDLSTTQTYERAMKGRLRKDMINSIQGKNFAEVKLGSKIYPPSQVIRINFFKIPNNAAPWQFS